MPASLGGEIRARWVLLALAVLLLVSGCGGDESPAGEVSLAIIGDVANPVRLAKMADSPELVTIEYREQKIEAVPLATLIELAEPYTDQLEILYQANDGFSALLNNEDITGCYIAFSAENGWEAINLYHPVSSNIKHIRHIVLIGKDLAVEHRFNVIEPGGDRGELSVGSVYKQGYSVVLVPRGTASVSHNGLQLNTTTFNQHRVVDLADYVNIAGRDSIVVGEKGEILPLRQDGLFVVNDNSIGYMAGEDTLPWAVGVVLDPPGRMVTDVYHDAKELLQERQQVLVILIDGLGYHQYSYAREHGFLSFLATVPEPELAMVAYPPVTPVNVAASLTGELPHINGVYKRGIRQAGVPTIFGFCAEQGLKSAAVIGAIGTIELEISPVYSLDANDDGSADDEKTEKALELFAEGYDLLFVHYKDVDRSGHDYGDLHPETLAAIDKVDSFVQRLVTNWNGWVLIYADHGMRTIGEGGDHGALASRDMFVPYWLFNRGEIND